MAATSVISVRVSESERHLLDEAAQNSRTNLSDFVRRQALDAAELVLMQRNVVTIAPEHWDELESWLNRPSRKPENLQKLAKSGPVWR